MMARVVYIQAAAFVKPKLPAFAVFKKPPFCWPEFDQYAASVRDYTAQRLAERLPVDIAALQAQVASLLAENAELKSQLAVPGSPDSAMPTPVPIDLLQVPASVQFLSSAPGRPLWRPWPIGRLCRGWHTSKRANSTPSCLVWANGQVGPENWCVWCCVKNVCYVFFLCACMREC